MSGSATRLRPRPRRRDELHEKQQDLLLAWRDGEFIVNNDST